MPGQGQQIRGLTRQFAQRFEAPENTEITHWINRATSVVQQYNLQGSRVLVVGSAFGYLVEALKDAGVANVWGIDNSPYAHSILAQHKRGDVTVINGDIRTVRWQEIRAVTGDRYFDCIITEDVVTCYPNAEIAAVLDRCEFFLYAARPKSRIVHLLTPDVDLTAIGGAPARILEEWAAVRPAHSWCSVSGLRHIVGIG